MLPLLLLALALLGGPACQASELYGKRGGLYYFSTPEDYDFELSAIRVSVGFSGLCKRQGGQAQTATLNAGEFVIWVSGYFREFIRSLELCTNLNRCFSFGVKSGQFFFAQPDREGQVLTGFFGHYGPLGIKNMGFKWASPLEKVSAEPTSMPMNTTSIPGHALGDEAWQARGHLMWGVQTLSPHSIQARYGPFWDAVHGVKGGQAQTATLNAGEFVIWVSGYFREFIRSLELCTNLNRCFSFGVKSGQFFFAQPDREGQVLTGFFGHYGPLGIKNMGFKWASPLEKVSAEPTSMPMNTTSM
ncbi:Zymogen granule protein 16 like protein B [Tupaia chinensis]|uniref:Zymogen granule protein 16 like protein B n=1 Tax=Tupaia chinensis TaxID=246437 RepID=L9KZA6_TUPCH|nr:Zymogen granule protein 16 like protein B [Tupaia chinensis]